jgi:hypothetical protein
MTVSRPRSRSLRQPRLQSLRVRAHIRPIRRHDVLALSKQAKGAGLKDPYLDEDIVPLALSERDIDDVVAFLASLTSPAYKAAADIELARQRELSRTTRPQRDTARAFGPKPACSPK